MKTSKEIIEKMKNLAAEGKQAATIAKILNVDARTVKKYVGDSNLTKPKNSINGNEQLILQLYSEGKTQQEIAKLLGTYNTSIRRVLIKHNVKIRSNSEIQRLCKTNPFKDSDEYSEYFLGLLLTDGCITKCKNSTRNYSIVLSLSEKDKYLIEYYRNWISPNTKISKIYQRINGSYMYSVSVSNPEVEKWLRERGEFTDKSHNCQIYCPITWHILRGIFDGDGGFHLNSKHLDFFVCGASKIFMEQICSFLENNGFDPHLRTTKRNNKEFYYVEIYKISEVIRLGKLMYNNASIYLTRKYDKWLSFYESKSNKQTLNSGKDALSNPEQNSSTQQVINKVDEDVQRL